MLTEIKYTNFQGLISSVYADLYKSHKMGFLKHQHNLFMPALQEKL